MQDYIIFEGQKTPSEVAAMLEAASIFSSVSYYEGLPLAMLEAMNIGLPLISFDIPTGPKDLITDNGFLIEDNQFIAYADKLSLLMADTSLRKKLGAASKKCAGAFYKDAVLDQWEQLFNAKK